MKFTKKRRGLCAAIIFLVSIGFFVYPARSNAQTTKVKVYLVAVDDNGKNGKKIGCGDSLIAVSRDVESTGAPLKAALEELLSMTGELSEGDQKLENFWKGENLKLESVSLKKGTATVKISGTLTVAGICDEPRIIEQIEMTAKQFNTVKKVKVWLNGEQPKDAIR